MSRHPLDLLSLVLGLIVVAMGVAALSGDLGRVANQPVALVPLAAALAGVALIASARRQPSGPASSEEPPAANES